MVSERRATAMEARLQWYQNVEPLSEARLQWYQNVEPLSEARLPYSFSPCAFISSVCLMECTVYERFVAHRIFVDGPFVCYRLTW